MQSLCNDAKVLYGFYKCPSLVVRSDNCGEIEEDSGRPALFVHESFHQGPLEFTDRRPDHMIENGYIGTRIKPQPVFGISHCSNTQGGESSKAIKSILSSLEDNTVFLDKVIKPLSQRHVFAKDLHAPSLFSQFVNNNQTGAFEALCARKSEEFAQTLQQYLQERMANEDEKSVPICLAVSYGDFEQSTKQGTLATIDTQEKSVVFRDPGGMQ